jgi:hypothetical protein
MSCCHELCCRENVAVSGVWVRRKPYLSGPPVDRLKDRDEKRIVKCGIKQDG